jgi:hypothetical protein
MWLGLGGYSPDDTLFQTGTESDCVTGVPTYYAWWEQVPDPKHPSIQYYKVHVAAGDQIYAGVSLNSSSTIKLNIADYQPNGGPMKWAKSKILADTTASRSVECIVERPTLLSGGYPPLADFNQATFNNCEGSEIGYGTSYLYRKAKFPGAPVRVLNMLDAQGSTLVSVAQSQSIPFPITATWVAAE